MMQRRTKLRNFRVGILVFGICFAAFLRPGSAKEKAATSSPAPAVEKKDEAGDQASREQIDGEKAKARSRMREDSRKYSAEQIADAEKLYQSANKNLRSPEAKGILETMVQKYPKLNRTGCAILYLAQQSKADDREKYLKQAIDDFSDCFYGNGVQVGAFARYLLGHYYLEKGDAEKGKTLLNEVIQKFPKSITHHRDQLAKITAADLNVAPAKK